MEVVESEQHLRGEEARLALGETPAEVERAAVSGGDRGQRAVGGRKEAGRATADLLGEWLRRVRRSVPCTCSITR